MLQSAFACGKRTDHSSNGVPFSAKNQRPPFAPVSDAGAVDGRLKRCTKEPCSETDTVMSQEPILRTWPRKTRP
jgi:hypothetical protein